MGEICDPLELFLISVLVLHSSACEHLHCQVTVNMNMKNHKTAVMSYAVIAK